MGKQEDVEWYRREIIEMVNKIQNVKLLNQIHTIIEIRMEKQRRD